MRDQKPTPKKIILATVIILILTLIFFGITKLTYKKEDQISFNEELKCTHYYEDCVCLGFLSELNTQCNQIECFNPKKYSCNGLELCKDINEEDCE